MTPPDLFQLPPQALNDVIQALSFIYAGLGAFFLGVLVCYALERLWTRRAGADKQDKRQEDAR